MPSYVDFNASKRFRDFVISKTLTVPNGPQTFNASNYSVHNLNVFPNIDPGTVEDTREFELTQSQNVNTFKPTEYFINENLNVFTRRANLNLYPYFVGRIHNLIGIMSSKEYDDESELMKFAAWNINTNPQGPFFARVTQNLISSTVGRLRLVDALGGNTTTAINILTGREPLIETNTKITVASTLPGKGIDFLQTITGVEFPWVEIPGDYLSNPRNPIITKQSEEKTISEFKKTVQDTTGALGSLIGIRRRSRTQKPSDLFIEYMGQRQRSFLFDNLSYSKYAPNYTTTARSQNTSKIFNFIDQTAQSVKNILGIEAPNSVAYIGDDRGEDVYYAMNDFNDRPVRSNYYLVQMFDPIQATLFQRQKNIIDGGGVAGKLTWISTKSKNPLPGSQTLVGLESDKGRYTTSYKRTQSQGQYIESVSTNYNFEDKSILGKTQEILESMPDDGGAARSHVANVIDQTSRIFREGDVILSRGSSIKYFDKYTKQENGIEYCRVWTKDRSYINYSDTMKKSGNYRKFESSVLTKPWNLNIYPNSNARGEFGTSSSNMSSSGQGWFAKKYMFSIENLAWKTSNIPGFTYTDLPVCERGPNGGRIMWLPPYDLKISEQNNASWKDNDFLGRPEPVFTYTNTTRTGQVSFKVIVDHPSILNLLVRKHFEGISDQEADNYINAFFAGCEDIDFYSLVRKYVTLSPDEVKAVMAYLNGNGEPQPIAQNKLYLVESVKSTPKPKNKVEDPAFMANLYFKNDTPEIEFGNPLITNQPYGKQYETHINSKEEQINELSYGIETLLKNSTTWDDSHINDYLLLSGVNSIKKPSNDDFDILKISTSTQLRNGFDALESEYQKYLKGISKLKDNLDKGKVKNIIIRMGSSTSSPDSANNNLKLSYRRTYSVLIDLIFRLCKNYNQDPEAIIPNYLSGDLSQYNDVVNTFLKWKVPITNSDESADEPPIIIPLRNLGYPQDGNLSISVKNVGETFEPKKSIDITNMSCSDKVAYQTRLSRNGRIVNIFNGVAPTTFYCRKTQIGVKYELTDAETDTEDVVKDEESSPNVRNLVEINDDSPTVNKITPSIDKMKEIIMKTLTECYYFRQLEEDSPLQFSSLKEKLKYFHPSFHSMTPEGLNARLTFLNQCVRPGDTLPIKGSSDRSDMNARNTTFGPPPICVLRIGDFYHSKVIIRNVNITYDNSIWDLNPEGIGVQPMIADVQLDITFIGGQGLERPVERLQNALSSNFYANTEVYDPRSTSTEDRSKFYEKTFSKEFLENLSNRTKNSVKPNYSDSVTADNKYEEEIYGGQLEMTGDTYMIQYHPIIDKLYSDTANYFESLISAYNSTIMLYGHKLSSIILHPDYRSINEYIVQTPSGIDTIELLGNYEKNIEIGPISQQFKDVISNKIMSENITTLMKLNKDMPTNVAVNCEEILKPNIKKMIEEKINNITTETAYMNNIEQKRNKVIEDFDKLNYVMQYGHDGKIISKTQEYIGCNLSGYSKDKLFVYGDLISFIKTNQPKFYNDLDNTYNFFSSTMSTDDLSQFLSVLLRTDKEKILNLFRNSKKDIFSDKVIKNMDKRLDAFLASLPSNKNFSINHYPSKSNNNSIQFQVNEYTITDSDEIQDLIKTKRTSMYNPIMTLNFAR